MELERHGENQNGDEMGSATKDFPLGSHAQNFSRRRSHVLRLTCVLGRCRIYRKSPLKKVHSLQWELSESVEREVFSGLKVAYVLYTEFPQYI